MVRVPTLMLVIIAIATFAPHPLRGCVILLASAIAIWYSLTYYTPWEETPNLPDQPTENEKIEK